MLPPAANSTKAKHRIAQHGSSELTLPISSGRFVCVCCTAAGASRRSCSSTAPRRARQARQTAVSATGSYHCQSLQLQQLLLTCLREQQGSLAPPEPAACELAAAQAYVLTPPAAFFFAWAVCRRAEVYTRECGVPVKDPSPERPGGGDKPAPRSDHSTAFHQHGRCALGVPAGAAAGPAAAAATAAAQTVHM